LKEEQGMMEIESLCEQLPGLAGFFRVIITRKAVVTGVQANACCEKYGRQKPAAQA